jgi:branched-chain amino acid transport system ATP-binding protein/neutral amino acid transport system ATP-binding protein
MSAAGDAIPALLADGLRAGYGGGGDIVGGIDLRVPPEAILAVVGPNGSGKSTLVKALAGLLPLRAGRIAVTGTDVTRRSAAQRVLAGLAYVPQEANVFRGMTVQENLQLATEFLRGRTGVGPAREALVLELFPEVAARRRLLAGHLSGGQRQMLAFACALLANPEVLLLDEPSAGLSPKFVGEIMRAVRRARDTGVTIVLVEQNVKAALEIADIAAVLVGGRISRLAPARALIDADLGALFLGRAA